jgi:hypothetical protein
MRTSRPSVISFFTALTLLIAAGTALADLSNKWRLEFSGGADSDGVITIQISPKEGDPIEARIAISNNTGENAVAKAVTKALKEQLPSKTYHVERDDGEDVLIKKRRGASNFGVKIVSNTVKGVRINPDKE